MVYNIVITSITNDYLSFASARIDKNYSLTLPRWSRDQPQPGSFFQRPREAEEREPGNEIGDIILYLHKSHNTALLLPEICIGIVLDFSWDIFMSQEKLQTMIMQTFGE